jgi:hypothetical protein
VASTSTAAQPSRSTAQPSSSIDEPDAASVASSSQELNYEDLKVFGLDVPIRRWVDSYVGDAINLKNKLKRKEELIKKLEKNKENAIFPPDITFKFKGYTQYPQSIGEEETEALNLRELEVISKAQQQLLQIRLDALKKDAKKIKENVEKTRQLTFITTAFNTTFPDDIYPTSIVSMLSVIINTKLTLTCLDSATKFVTPANPRPTEPIMRSRKKGKKNIEEGPPTPPNPPSQQQQRQRHQKNGSRRGRDSTRGRSPHDPRKRSPSAQSSRSNHSRKSTRSVSFVDNNRKKKTYHQREGRQREEGSGKHQRSYSKR